ncbi:MAG: SurA N-terminal domain-containing protein [Candidatus Cloacimonetes bacterium]|jgi:hypothetical protein|nr:SurA N-terminal domain-containing protein [Candidatus Cloacimonadota bacterium]
MKRNTILAIIALMLFACAGPREDTAGIINSERISATEFINTYRSFTANFQLENQRMPVNEEKLDIYKETWNYLTRKVVLQQSFKHYKIQVSEQEVLDTLLSNIPPFILNNPTLMINGKFSHDLYNQSLRYDSPLNMSAIRKSYLESYVPAQKLKEKMIDEDLANKKKSGRIAEIAVSKADFDLVIFDPLAMEPILTDSEIEAYYQRDLKRFAMDPIYSIKYLSLPVTPRDEDKSFTAAIADSIFNQLSSGKSFETVIQERQEQLPGLSLLDPGFVLIENIDPRILPILEILPDNKYSNPLAIGQGYAIYQKLQRSKSMLSYRALQIPPILSPNTINAQYSHALAALNLARELGMETTADELGLTLDIKDNLSVKDLWYGDKVVVENVISKLMNHKKGDYLDPIYSTITGNWLVIQLTENQVNRVYPLEKVKHIIVPELTEMRQQSMARQKAENWLKENPDLRVVSGRDRVQQYQKSGIDSQYAGKSLKLVYLRAIDRHLSKKKPEVDSIGDLSVILIPRQYYPANGVSPDRDSLRDLYTKQKDPNWFEKWLHNQINKANIRVFVNP